MATFKLEWWGMEYISLTNNPGCGTHTQDFDTAADAIAFADDETLQRLTVLKSRPGVDLPGWAVGLLERLSKKNEAAK